MKKFFIPTAIAAFLATSSAYVMADTTTIGQKIDDVAIVSSINMAFAKDDHVRARKINVDSNKGTVVLRGVVADSAEKARAEELAKQSDGVVKVRNDLRVEGQSDLSADVKKDVRKASVAFDDAAINASVNSKYMADKELSSIKINVDVKNGVVWLKGTAPSTSAKMRATTLATNVEGVVKVHNELRVDG